MRLFISFIFIFWMGCSNAQHSKVNVIGAMKNVMWKGELQGNINLDTISEKSGLIGLGPVENLSGEIIILNGRSYKSYIENGQVKVEETFDLKAPFFAYANIKKWQPITLPDSIQTIKDLENYMIDEFDSERPIIFRLSGKFTYTKIHIVNLPPGAKVSSPDEAHMGRTFFDLKDEQSEIVGFFSKNHKSIFTHHDSFLHMHLLTEDKKQMGHVDELILGKSKIILFITDNED
jgi:acetolactate decarboxylase